MRRNEEKKKIMRKMTFIRKKKKYGEKTNLYYNSP